MGMSESTVDHWIYMRTRPDTLFKTPDLTPSPELSYILGTRYGDGSIYEYHKSPTHLYVIKLSVSDRSFVDEFNRCASSVLNRKGRYAVSEYYEGQTRMFRVQVTNKGLYLFMKKSLDEHKPVIESFPASFLRGFFDSEGCVSDKMLGVYNTNLELMRYVESLLVERFSIFPSKIGIVVRKGSTNSTPYGETVATKNCYQMSINYRDGIIRYKEKIGFVNADKLEKLNREVQKAMSRKRRGPYARRF